MKNLFFLTILFTVSCASNKYQLEVGVEGGSYSETYSSPLGASLNVASGGTIVVTGEDFSKFSGDISYSSFSLIEITPIGLWSRISLGQGSIKNLNQLNYTLNGFPNSTPHTLKITKTTLELGYQFKALGLEITPFLSYQSEAFNSSSGKTSLAIDTRNLLGFGLDLSYSVLNRLSIYTSGRMYSKTAAEPTVPSLTTTLKYSIYFVGLRYTLKEGSSGGSGKSK